jgi:hypothetical protein
MATARTFPGNQRLSHPAALELVKRGTRPAASSGDSAAEKVQIPDNPNDELHHSGPVQFVHDPRLSWPSAQYFTEEQNDAIYRSIQCPVAFFRAHDGWPFEESKMESVRMLLNPDLFEIMPGSHHFHADPETAPDVADAVVSWLVGTETQARAAAADT